MNEYISSMRTSIDIDDQLLAKAHELTGIKSKTELVNLALCLYVTVENQKGLGELWGKIEIEEEAYK